MKELKSFKVDSPTVKISYLDTQITDGFETNSNRNNLAVVSKTIEVVLPQRESDYNYQLNVANFLKQNVKEIEIFPKFSFDKTFDDAKQLRNLNAKIVAHQYFILNEGRLKMADTIIMNGKTGDKYKSIIESANVVINDYIEDDTFYLISNTEINQPGYKYIYHIDNDNKYYSDIVSVGISPEKQAAKFVIY